MAWGVPLLGAVTETTVSGGNLTLPEHASAADGQLQVAFIAYRSNATFSPPASEGWNLVATQQSSGDTDATNGIASAVMYWRVRSGAGTRVFTRTAGNVAQGLILSYPVTAGTVPEYVTGSANTLASVNVTVTTATFNTSTTGELIVCGCSVGDNFNVSAFDAATDPTTASGATDTTTAPTAGTWLERVDVGTGTGADSGIAVADAIRATAGATGTIQCTSGSACRSAMIAGCFKMVPAPQTVNATAVAAALTMPNASITVGGITVTATALALALTIPNPTITSALTIQATAAPLTLTVPDASVTVGAVTIQATPCGLTLTIPNAGITYDQSVQATPVALGLTIPDAGITTGPVTLTATPVSLVLAVPDATVTAGAITIQGTAATLALAMPDAGITTGPVTVQATATPLALTIPDAAITTGAITAQATAVALTLTVPDAIVTSGGQQVQATAVSLALGIPDASLTAGAVTIQATALALALEVPDAIVAYDQVVPATAAALTLVVPDATLTPGAVTVQATALSLVLMIPDAIATLSLDKTVTVAAVPLTLTIPRVHISKQNNIAVLFGSRLKVRLAPSHYDVSPHQPRANEMGIHKIKVADLLPELRATLYGSDGVTPQDLSQATVRIHVKKPDGTLFFDRPVSAIEDALGGVVRYDWAAGDTVAPGRYTAEFEATIAGRPGTWPNDRDLVILMSHDMAGWQAVQATAAALALTVPDPVITQT